MELISLLFSLSSRTALESLSNPSESLSRAFELVLLGLRGTTKAFPPQILQVSELLAMTFVEQISKVCDDEKYLKPLEDLSLSL